MKWSHVFFTTNLGASLGRRDGISLKKYQTCCLAKKSISIISQNFWNWCCPLSSNDKSKVLFMYTLKGIIIVTKIHCLFYSTLFILSSTDYFILKTYKTSLRERKSKGNTDPLLQVMAFFLHILGWRWFETLLCHSYSTLDWYPWSLLQGISSCAFAVVSKLILILIFSSVLWVWL